MISGTPATAGEHVADLRSSSLPSVDVTTFRKVMGSFASGVSVVTTLDEDGVPRGFTCSALCSVSSSPPLLLSCANSVSSTMRAILDRGRFAVNILGSRGTEISRLFASRGTDGKFERIGWDAGVVTGMPLLRATVAHAECELSGTVEAGDHTMLLGRIVGGDAFPERAPLTYWRGGYATLHR
ncbi:flavin reductase family protein [Actinomadura soli]|uniref:Flavin reductase family protein n=1 Tax=Actinomadura soli TaxID=2508997 RepID=A0A5C4JG91_9ACTN|nr:flavin reductase family protein [Actinomadura soli]TMR02589.1 flavin reductase family protein [Actinomadura soli]